MKKLLAFALILSLLFTMAGISADAAEKTVTFEIFGTENYDYANEVLRLTNEARAEVGLSPLVMSESLLESAMQRAAECAIYYSHTRPNGESCFTSINGFYMSAGENIAIGYSSPEAVATGWIKSEGHYANMINSSFNSIGIGCFKTSNGTLCWVQLFTDTTASNPDKGGSQDVFRTITAATSNLSLVASLDRTSVTVKNTNLGFSYATQVIETSSFTYSVDDTSIAHIDENGVITSVGNGTVEITAAMKSLPSFTLTVSFEASGLQQREPSFNSDGTVTNIPLGSTAIDYPDYDITDAHGNLLLGDDVISTGCRIYNGFIPYDVVVIGDINGDASVNSTDFIQVRRKFLGLYEMTEVQIAAADVNSDGNVNSTDFMQIRKHFLGSFDLYS